MQNTYFIENNINEEKMTNLLKILFIPSEGVGHVNACIGLAEPLLRRGHRIIFAIDHTWKGKLVQYGFEEVVCTRPKPNSTDNTEKLLKTMVSGTFLIPLPAVDRLKSRNNTFLSRLEKVKNIDPIYGNYIEKIKPQLIIIDQLITIPSVIKCGIPWIYLSSTNPLYLIDDENTPLFSSGLSCYDTKSKFKEFIEIYNERMKESLDACNSWIVSEGCPPLMTRQFINPSPYLNLYVFPKEIDYTDLRPIPPKWLQIDCVRRSFDINRSFELPDKLKSDEKGKLIYFSLGTIGSENIELMKQLVSVLSKTKHRYIVSKGSRHEKYELADNMCGEGSLPQLKVLPIVDLVISHGGTNTIIEALYFGKPMIALPLFADQYDNAQRLHDTGYGIRVDLYDFNENQLYDAIEKQLNDKDLALKLNNISKRMQNSENIFNAIEKIEELADKH